MPTGAASRASAEERAGLDPCASRAAPARRHADAAVGGVSRRRAGRLRLQPLVRALPRLGGPAVADHAPVAPGRRALFVDYAGQTVEIVDGRTGEVREAQIFVAAAWGSPANLCRGDLEPDVADWIGAHIRALAFWAACRAQLVPDNLKSGVERANFYDPGLNPTYLDMAGHYGTAILPTRVRKPRDKAKVEVAVLEVERWILAPAPPGLLHPG